jgi:N-acetylglucosaminyldiphosphoundecaprenol N-acetyl-beta-D-mannosaminyltransferase
LAILGQERQRNRFNVLGVRVDVLSVPDTTRIIEGWIAQNQRQYICVANVYTIMQVRRNRAYRDAYRGAGLITPDGMPLVWMGRLAGYHEVGRVYGPDLMLAVCAALPDARHYFYGTDATTLERLIARLRQHAPTLNIAGMHAPPFRPLSPEEDAVIVAEINRCAPDVIWVGLGAPRQELWMASHRPLLNAPVLIGVGAAFDYLSGVKRQAPRWMQRSGLEWLFRLATEPRRLWRRYLFSVPSFMVLAAAQVLRLRRFDDE